MGGGKRLFQLIYQTTSLKTFIKMTNLEKCIKDLAVANAVGDKIPMFVIGKANKSRCYKNVKCLPWRYRNQQKSLMDGVLFEEWVWKMDKKFVSEGRKVALVIENYPANPHMENLKSIKFLLPNTASQSQQMEQSGSFSLKTQ